MRYPGIALALTFAFVLASFSAQAVLVASPQELCVASWVWDTTEPEDPYWRSPFPDSTLGLLDLRTLPQMGSRGPTPQGFGLFVLDTPGLCVGADGFLLALEADLEHSVRPLEATALEIGLDMDTGALTALTTRSMLWEIFTDDADPTGQNGVKPLRGTLESPVNMLLGGYGEIRSEVLAGTHLTNSEDVFRADFRRNFNAGMAESSLRRWTGVTMVKLYGVATDANADRLMPSEHRSIGWECADPRLCTTITESWDCGDSATIDCDLSWTEVTGTNDFEIISQKLEDNNNDIQSARADSDLSSDDHYAQADVTWEDDAGGSQGGTAVRFASSAETFYAGTGHPEEDQRIIYKYVTGSPTRILEEAQTIGAETLTVKTEVDVDDITATIGASSGSVTDTAITGNVRTGVHGFNNATESDGHKWDDFEASDLGAAPARRVILITKVWGGHIHEWLKERSRL